MEDLLKKIETDSRQLAANAPPNSEIVKLKKEIDKIMARMMPIKGGKIDPTRLLQSAQALANTISELVGHTKSEILINQGVDSASLDKIMGGIENYIKNHPGNGEKVEIDSLLKGLEFMDKLPKNANSPWNSTFENSFSTSNNNNQSLHDVATSVEKAAASARSKSKGTLSKAILQNCDSLASQLDALGNAMQFGSGTQLIESSRSISQLVNTLVNEDLKKLKDKCASPIEQEKLVRCSQALKNLSIQLKILASVNASSGASSSSEESHRLTELALNLGKALVETMNSVHSAELTTK